MKQMLLLLSTLLYCLSCVGQFKYSINITSQSLSGKKLRLDIMANDQNFYPIKSDSVLVVNGKATLSGDLDQSSRNVVIGLKYKGRFIEKMFFLDSGVNNLVVELPTQNGRVLSLQSDAKGEKINTDMNRITEEALANYPEPTRINGILKIPVKLTQEIRLQELKHVEEYKNEFGGLLYLYRMSHSDTNTIKDARLNLAAFLKFSDHLKTSALGKAFYEEQTSLIDLKTASAAGRKVKTFIVNDINNNSFSNAALDGQPYMIVFCATWCGPCQLQLPKIMKVYDSYKEKGLKVVYFNIDSDVERWKDHVAKNNLTWINVSERLKWKPGQIPGIFGVFAIPVCIVVDKKGMIIYNSDDSDDELIQMEKSVRQAVL
jgi:thiol-disulfide isomerase/thioredoxin